MTEPVLVTFKLTDEEVARLDQAGRQPVASESLAGIQRFWARACRERGVSVATLMRCPEDRALYQAERLADDEPEPEGPMTKRETIAMHMQAAIIGSLAIHARWLMSASGRQAPSASDEVIAQGAVRCADALLLALSAPPHADPPESE